MYNVNEDNFQIVAAKSYQNICFSTKEFFEDLSVIENIKSDITRYFNIPEERSLRILLNKLTVISNQFTPEIAQKLLFYRLRNAEEHINFLKTVYTFLDVMPDDLFINDELQITNKYIIIIDLWRSLEHVFGERKKLPFE